MENIKNNDDEFDGLATVGGIVFLVMAGFLIYFAIGEMAIVTDNSAYIFMGFSLMLLVACSFALWSRSKIGNLILVIYTISFFSISFLGKTNIQEFYVSGLYDKVNESMISSYSGIIETPVYQAFLIDKNNNDASKIKEYRSNISSYTSINPEKVMQLKILYTATSNKEIHNKLDLVFSDGLVNNTEYDEFKTFVYKLPLNAKDQSLFTMIQN